MNINKYNKKPLFEYDNDKEREFINLKQLVNNNGMNESYIVHALFINTKSKFGNAPVVVTDTHMVNAPEHLLEVVQDMLRDDELLELINNRKIGFTIYAYQGKNGDGYSIEWYQVTDSNGYTT